MKNQDPQFIFINPESSFKIQQKHLMASRKFILTFDVKKKYELKHEVLQIADALIHTEATELEFQILISALKFERGKSQSRSKSIIPRGDAPRLTPREIQILHYLSRGKSDLALSHQLHVGLPTIKTHERRIFSKLGVNNRTHGVAQAIRWNII